ncbi:MAG TPA: glycosyltransferase family 87 protein [Phycisphaerae bacterium]|nr:glycosyltransferase family 87 protein [Phycisphaerae bacterium]
MDGMASPADGNEWRGRRQRLALGAAVSFALLCGLYVVRAGLFAGGDYRAVDAYWHYAAGKCWLHGESPYHVDSFYARWREAFDRGPVSPYVFPPTMAIVAVPMALLPWVGGQWLFDAANLLALLLVLYFSKRLIDRSGLVSPRSPGKWIWPGAACLISGVPACIFVGQVGLIAAAGLVGALYSWQRGRAWWCAAFVVVASAKPQVSLLLLVYMFVVGRRRGVVLGGLAVAALAALVLAWAPGESLSSDVRQSIEGYRLIPFNRWERYDTLSRVLGRTPLESVAVYGAMGAAAVLVCLIGFRDGLRIRTGRVSDDDRAGFSADNPPVLLPSIVLVLAATGLFMPLHVYDFGLYVPVMVSLAAFGWRRRLWLLVGLILIARPHNIETVLAHVPFCRVWLEYAPVSLIGGLVTFAGATVLYVQRRSHAENVCPLCALVSP